MFLARRWRRLRRAARIWWTFERVDVANQILERLPAKPRRSSESGYQGNRIGH